jgi:hypothetical protein
MKATRVTPNQRRNQREIRTLIKEREETSNPLRNIPTPKLESQRRKRPNVVTATMDIIQRMHA